MVTASPTSVCRVRFMHELQVNIVRSIYSVLKSVYEARNLHHSLSITSTDKIIFDPFGYG